MISINDLGCGTSDCTNLIQMAAVKNENKIFGRASYLFEQHILSSASIQTVDVNQKPAIEKVNILIVNISTIRHNQSDD